MTLTGVEKLAIQLPSQCFEERNQGLLVFWREHKPELVTFDCARLHAIAYEARWHVVISEPLRIEPVFERRHGAIVLKRAAAETASLVTALLD